MIKTEAFGTVLVLDGACSSACAAVPAGRLEAVGAGRGALQQEWRTAAYCSKSGVQRPTAAGVACSGLLQRFERPLHSLLGEIPRRRKAAD